MEKYVRVRIRQVPFGGNGKRYDPPTGEGDLSASVKPILAYTKRFRL